ncbi:MAG: AIR carboxylase family protein, partial [Candidatus Saccharimonadales bacterium]
LGGMLAANLRWPVISCPPFKDHSDYLANIHSSLQMPSGTPNLTILDPGNAALAAANILQTIEAVQ